MGNTCFNSLKYFRTVMPRCVTAKTTRFLPIVRSSIRPCFMRKSRYSFSTLQLTFALYITWVSFRGPRCASTVKISTYISSFDRRIFCSSFLFYLSGLIGFDYRLVYFLLFIPLTSKDKTKLIFHVLTYH